MPLSALAPLVLLAAAALAFARPGRRPQGLPRLVERAAQLSLALAILGAVQLAITGPASLAVGSGVFALVLVQDVISATMTLLVAFVGWITVRYTRSYLDGEAREGTFHGLLLATIAAVLLLVQAGSLLVLVLGFVAVGPTLQRLLLFYPDRPAARRVAAKFSLVWRAGDLTLLLAALCLWLAFGTADLAEIRAMAAAGVPAAGQLAIGLLVLAALLKTAAFPLHGWLTEVMEAPTPVSALLHAGIINAGGFLLIRMADLVQASPAAMATLVLLGGGTALFGGLVMLTQSAVKTALAWSTVAQMGFMLLQCGLGLWPIALLHLVAHSLYKAHAFLASGTAVHAVLASRRPGPVATPGASAVARAFALALLLYGVVAAAAWLLTGPKSPQALALGAILIFGVAYLIAQGLADRAPAALTRQTSKAATLAAIAYFGFQWLALQLAGPALPPAPVPGPLEWALIGLALGSFAAVAVAQALFPNWAHHPAAAGLRVHLANGLYVNAIFDRLIGGYRNQPR